MCTRDVELCGGWCCCVMCVSFCVCYLVMCVVYFSRVCCSVRQGCISYWLACARCVYLKVCYRADVCRGKVYLLYGTIDVQEIDVFV